ncbi:MULTISPECIES: hypothetical protein [unclassified Arthrobacter]|uniref:hypothetical protein n=1 Tax=unclassified Arthrobacter TaxID=235627 RepID=UPI0011B0143C|nr:MULTISPECIES: hypothetical protein [unclassified Arthrobacter]
MYYSPALSDGHRELASTPRSSTVSTGSASGGLCVGAARVENTVPRDQLEVLEAAERARLIDEIRLLEELKSAVAAAQARDAAARAPANDVYSEGVGVACDAVVDSMGTFQENGSFTQADALESLYEAVSNRNHQAGTFSSLEDIQKAIRKIQAGQNADLDILIIGLTYCDSVT